MLEVSNVDLLTKLLVPKVYLCCQTSSVYGHYLDSRSKTGLVVVKKFALVVRET